ncbi:MAG: hypothetical protein ACPGXK_12615, partial [Phycisphaerae bacterium]
MRLSPQLNRRLITTVALVISLAPISASFADSGSPIIFVDSDAPGIETGNSWMDAYTSLQDAIANVTGNTDQIWVAAGTYYPDEGAAELPDDVASTFNMVADVAIIGGFAGTEDPMTFNLRDRDLEANETILSGDLLQDDNPAITVSDLFTDVTRLDNAYRVVTAANGTLDGFTITAGNNQIISAKGGGLFNPGATPLIKNCTFVLNSADEGGAIGDVEADAADVVLINCMLRENGAMTGAAFAGGELEMINCVANGNESGSGSEFVVDNGSIAVRNSTLATIEGSPIINLSLSNIFVTNSILDTPLSPVTVRAEFGSSGSISFSNLSGSLENVEASVSLGAGMLSVDPEFVSRAGPDGVPGNADDDLRLSKSPLRDAGSNSLLPTDTLDVDADGNTNEPLPIDFAGDKRQRDALMHDDVGEGTAPIVDMGAYEYRGVVFVNDDASGSADGSSWEDAYTTLQDALQDPLVDNGIIPFIWMAGGTYKPDQGGNSVPGDRSATFTLPAGMTLMGGFAGNEVPGIFNPFNGDGRDFENNETILSGDLNGDDVLPLSDFVTCFTGEPLTTGCEVFDADMDGIIMTSDLEGFLGTNNYNDNSRTIVEFVSGATDTTLNGLTIRRANSIDMDQGAIQTAFGTGKLIIDQCIVEENASLTTAGARIEGSQLTVRDSFLRNNVSGGAGGAINSNFFTNTVDFVRSTFERNRAGESGGAAILSGTTSIRRCEFRDNIAGTNGGIFHSGGAVATSFDSEGTNFSIVNSTFENNSAAPSGTGGAVNITGLYVQAYVANCVFRNNQLRDSGGLGGALQIDSSNKGGSTEIRIANSEFVNNSAGTGTSLGGAMQLVGTGMFLSNLTIVGNSANNGGGIHFTGDGAINNSILWANDAFSSAQIAEDGQTACGDPDFCEGCCVCGLLVDSCIIDGAWCYGSDVSNADPQFVDPTSGSPFAGADDTNFSDVRLAATSPAIDAGNNDFIEFDDFDVDRDGDTEEVLPIDLDGNRRRVDDQLTEPDPGNPGKEGPPVIDIGAYEFSRDCDGNGIPDSEDLSECVGDPSCSDCDGNGQPDSCDIFACNENSPAFPGCDDCNLNGVPDACDIQTGTSLDIEPTDGVPDECVASQAGGVTTNWTDITNWPPLSTPMGPVDGYPDGDGSSEDAVPDQHVTINEETTEVVIFLDETVTIDSLRILGGAELLVTNESSPNQQFFGKPFGPSSDGDLNIVPGGEIFIEGDPIDGDVSSLKVASDRQVNAQGSSFELSGNGNYSSSESALPDVTATLTANDITLQEGEPAGGKMNLNDSMAVIADGDVTLNGMLVGTGTSCTPPVLNMNDSSSMDVMGDFSLNGGVNFSLGGNATLNVGGNYNDGSNEFADIDIEGTITVGSPTGFASGPAQRIEASGTDTGATFASADAANTISNLVIGDNASVVFEDVIDNNGVGQAPLTEAVYTKSLTFGTNSVVVIDGCRVYYETLTDNATSVTLINNGELVQITGVPAAARADDRFDVNGTIKMCESDADCQAGETGPSPQTFCREQRCYVARQRYLSVRPNPVNDGILRAIRISLDTGVGGKVVLGFVQEPLEVFGPGPGPQQFDLARIDAAPFYANWNAFLTDRVTIGDCEISPGHQYVVEVIAIGDDVTNDGLYSAPLRLPTAANHGDVTGGGSPGDPPN